MEMSSIGLEHFLERALELTDSQKHTTRIAMTKPADGLGELHLAERVLPSSKSQSNRALILAASAMETSKLCNLSIAEDTVVLRLALAGLGCKFHEDSPGDWSIAPQYPAGPLVCSQTLFLGSAGSSFRFLLAWLASRESCVQMDCTDQLRRRPMEPLLAVLRHWEAKIESIHPQGQPPYSVQGKALSGGEILADNQISSQFLSALLLSAPSFKQGLHVRFDGSRQVSMSYIWQTLAVMKQFAIKFEIKKNSPSAAVSFPGKVKALSAIQEPMNRCDDLYIPRQTISGCHQVKIEPDAASASYVAAAAIFTKRRVFLPGLQMGSTQPEMDFFRILSAKNPGFLSEPSPDGLWVDGRVRLKAFDVNMGQAPDSAMTLAVLACSIDGRSTIRGIAHNRLKESNRIEGFVGALQRLGIVAQACEDGFWIHGRATTPTAGDSYTTLDTGADHRMVMSLSLLALLGYRLQLTDLECIVKSFPNYFSAVEPFGLICL
jgi:3-phosphoshikimate 1-carboxyvinyltransferase